MNNNTLEERLLIGILNNYDQLLSNDTHHWQITNAPPAIESAYQSILAERDETLAPTPIGPPLTEDDILCNTNLQTATLFKKLNEKYKEVVKELMDTNDTKKSLEESLVKLQKALQNIKDNCYDQDGSEEIISTQVPFLDSVNKVVKQKSHALSIKREELEKERDDIDRKLNALRKLITTSIHDLVKPEDVHKKICPVCFDKEVSMVYIPCGHTYCKQCSDLDNSRHAKCPQCRSHINARVKIFFTV
jgi:hypothetical protein